MVAALLVSGLVGLGGMTVLFPLLARLFHSNRRRGTRQDDGRHDLTGTVAILIPAHNEAASIGVTLRSIQLAIAHVRTRFPAATFRICVGADCCDDETEVEARVHGAEITSFSLRQGKWRTLTALVRGVPEAAWVIFADAGIEWPENFLSTILPHTREPQIMGLAPSYDNAAGGGVERGLWNLERLLKRLEQSSGGPVTVHGASVCYRRRELLAAIDQLGTHAWLNDDVVIPLTLRGLFPDQSIRYLPHLKVSEVPRPELRGPEISRRKRMARGNVEWIRELWIPLWRQNPVAALIASRRVFRLLWAYWGVLLGTAAVLIAASVLPAVIRFDDATVAGILAVSIAWWASKLRPVYRLAECALASLGAPLQFIPTRSEGGTSTREAVAWK